MDRCEEGCGTEVHPRPIAGEEAKRGPQADSREHEDRGPRQCGEPDGTRKTMLRSAVSLRDSQPEMSDPRLPCARGGASLPTSNRSRTRTGASSQNRFCANCTQIRPGVTSLCAGSEGGRVADGSPTPRGWRWVITLVVARRTRSVDVTAPPGRISTIPADTLDGPTMLRGVPDCSAPPKVTLGDGTSGSSPVRLAGVRQPMQDKVTLSGRRILEPPFMEINQAVGLPRGIDPRALEAVSGLVEDLKKSDFIADELARSGIEATVAPHAR